MLFSECIEEYGQHLRVERGYTQATCKTYIEWLRTFNRWLDGDLERAAQISDLSSSIFKKYLYHCHSLQYRPRTIRTCFFGIRGLCAYLTDLGVFKENPVLSLRLPKLDAPERVLVTDDEVRALLDSCDRIADTVKALRSRALLSCMAYCALRQSELLHLRLGDLYLDEGRIVVASGKGQKRREIYPHADCVQAIQEYLPHRPADCKHDFLFCVDRNRRASVYTLKNTLEELASIAGYREELHRFKCHALRRNTATRLLRAGADIRSIQHLLGHSDLKITALYLSTDVNRLREISVLGGLRAPQPKPSAIATPHEPRFRKRLLNRR